MAWRRVNGQLDLEVLKSSARWLADGHRVLLVTVVKTWGSSPRPVGAMLAVRADGHVAGSGSGGCIEDDLIDRVRQRGLEQERPQALKYGVSAQEAHRFGLHCGGIASGSMDGDDRVGSTFACRQADEPHSEADIAGEWD